MKYYLAKWRSNWADEMDVEGAVILNEKDKERFDKEIEILKQLEKKFGYKSLGVCIGTNEYIEYDNSSELLKEISFTEINENEVNILKKLKMNRIGKINAICCILEGDYIEMYECEVGEEIVDGFLGKEICEKYIDWYYSNNL